MFELIVGLTHHGLGTCLSSIRARGPELGLLPPSFPWLDMATFATRFGPVFIVRGAVHSCFPANCHKPCIPTDVEAALAGSIEDRGSSLGLPMVHSCPSKVVAHTLDRVFAQQMGAK